MVDWDLVVMDENNDEKTVASENQVDKLNKKQVLSKMSEYIEKLN